MRNLICNDLFEYLFILRITDIIVVVIALWNALLVWRLPKVADPISFICGLMQKLVVTLVFFPYQNENNHGNKEVNKRGCSVLYQRTNEVSCCKFVWVIIQAETLGSQCLNSCPCSIQKDQESNPNNMLIFNKSLKIAYHSIFTAPLDQSLFHWIHLCLEKINIHPNEYGDHHEINQHQRYLYNIIGDLYELRNLCIIVHEIDTVDDDTQNLHEDKDGNNADFEDFQHSVLVI